MSNESVNPEYKLLPLDAQAILETLFADLALAEDSARRASGELGALTLLLEDTRKGVDLICAAIPRVGKMRAQVEASIAEKNDRAWHEAMALRRDRERSMTD